MFRTLIIVSLYAQEVFFVRAKVTLGLRGTFRVPLGYLRFSGYIRGTFRVLLGYTTYLMRFEHSLKNPPEKVQTSSSRKYLLGHTSNSDRISFRRHVIVLKILDSWFSYAQCKCYLMKKYGKCLQNTLLKYAQDMY